MLRIVGNGFYFVFVLIGPSNRSKETSFYSAIKFRISKSRSIKFALLSRI